MLPIPPFRSPAIMNLGASRREIAPLDTSDRTKSNPTAGNSGSPLAAPLYRPPTRSRITESFHSHISPTTNVRDESLGAELAPGSEAAETPLVARTSREILEGHPTNRLQWVQSSLEHLRRVLRCLPASQERAGRSACRVESC
jgi:hypothetical protein